MKINKIGIALLIVLVGSFALVESFVPTQSKIPRAINAIGTLCSNHRSRRSHHHLHGQISSLNQSGYDVDKNVRNEIKIALRKIGKDYGVKVLYACESGSRAWGFPSADSDYDVRFLYVHPVDWYLSIDPNQRDVIEVPISDELDISGWDLRNALGLFRKSNPALLEWLGSPIVYVEEYTTAERMRDLASETYSPTSCQHHYFSMAKSNFRGCLEGDRVRTKKYFYVLRALLAVIWLEQDLGVVPTEFLTLVEATLSDGALKTAIDKLIDDKRSGVEMDDGPVIPVIHQFITDELSRLGGGCFKKKFQKAEVDNLNLLFKETLEEVEC